MGAMSEADELERLLYLAHRRLDRRDRLAVGDTSEIRQVRIGRFRTRPEPTVRTITVREFRHA